MYGPCERYGEHVTGIREHVTDVWSAASRRGTWRACGCIARRSRQAVPGVVGAGYPVAPSNPAPTPANALPAMNGLPARYSRTAGRHTWHEAIRRVACGTFPDRAVPSPNVTASPKSDCAGRRDGEEHSTKAHAGASARRTLERSCGIGAIGSPLRRCSARESRVKRAAQIAQGRPMSVAAPRRCLRTTDKMRMEVGR